MKMKLLVFVLSAFLLAACNVDNSGNKADTSAGKPETKEQKYAYSLGVDIAKSIEKKGYTDLDPDFIAEGVADYLKDDLTMQMSEIDRSFGEYVTMFNQRKQDEERALAVKNLRNGQAFLQSNKEKEGVQVTPSGLQYKVLEEGSGESPGPNDTVVVHYEGRLIDGTEFDSSFDASPVELKIMEMIPGWIEALQMMKPGSMWEIYIPPSLAYGNKRASIKVGPNATLIFKLKLLEVK